MKSINLQINKFHHSFWNFTTSITAKLSLTRSSQIPWSSIGFKAKLVSLLGIQTVTYHLCAQPDQKGRWWKISPSHLPCPLNWLSHLVWTHSMGLNHKRKSNKLLCCTREPFVEVNKFITRALMPAIFYSTQHIHVISQYVIFQIFLFTKLHSSKLYLQPSP